nr:2'-5' RNA ligase family protein [Micrococcus sp. KRD128]
MLFLAIRPPRAVLDHVEPALDGVRDRAGRALRWTEREQRHLTLAFHPEVPAGAVDDVVADAGRIAAGHAPLDLHLAGAGEFSHRTLWMGCLLYPSPSGRAGPGARRAPGGTVARRRRRPGPPARPPHRGAGLGRRAPTSGSEAGRAPSAGAGHRPAGRGRARARRVPRAGVDRRRGRGRGVPAR